MQDQPIQALFKLYPWEWAAQDAFAEFVADAGIAWFEPAWKQILTSKGIAAVLWEMFPDHPNLLPAAFRSDGLTGGGLVRKPLFGREGGNIQVWRDGGVVCETAGPYGAEGHVWQQWMPAAVQNGIGTALGLWMVGDTCCGLGIREDDGMIVRDSGRFVPHLIE